MMLADSCEAAARTLSKPDPKSIGEIVDRIVDAIVSDGQLNECDLTMRQLTQVREAIVTSLTAIYHARIDYPGFNLPALSSSTNADKAREGSETRGVSYAKPSDVPINQAGEVEDEAISRWSDDS